ncbi:hypothetical protein [Thermicanus aegyptius]|uniref:hypothetical protein n=1 Tax=Thermicanus aegyptius TaxID=94009 RepID=UPI0012EC3C6A|nr:hypothetical protein [Thermicanus aegyptius]
MDDAKRIFLQDVKDKKRIAVGVHSRKGVRGYVGKMHTPVDFLKGKAKREYTKGGEVIVYNMFDKLMPKEEFDKLDDEQKKECLLRWRDRYSTKQIMETLNLKSYQFYRLMDKFNIPRYHGGGPLATKTSTTSTPQTDEVKTNLSNGFNISLHGKYSAEKLIKRLLSISSILEGESSNFKVNITISEDEEK